MILDSLPPEFENTTSCQVYQSTTNKYNYRLITRQSLHWDFITELGTFTYPQDVLDRELL